MLKHALHNSERRCADYTFFSGIVCTQAILEHASDWQAVSEKHEVTSGPSFKTKYDFRKVEK